MTRRVQADDRTLAAVRRPGRRCNPLPTTAAELRDAAGTILPLQQREPVPPAPALSSAVHVVSTGLVIVSVVIPTYNRRAVVREAVVSVCAQEGVAREIIVVDDGSSDGSAAALQHEFGTGIRVLRTANHGVAAARNLGVAASAGELIAFLDSDDMWLPGKLAAQVAFFAAHPEAQICQTAEVWIRNGVRVNPRAHHRKPSGDIFEASLLLCLVSPSAVMLRRSLFERVGGFDESLAACEDYDLWLRILRTTPVWLIDRPLVIKRGGHADQLSRRFWGMDRFRVAALLRLLSGGNLTESQQAAAQRVLAEKCTILATGAARRGRSAEAQRYRTLAAVYQQDTVGGAHPTH